MAGETNFSYQESSLNYLFFNEGSFPFPFAFPSWITSHSSVQTNLKFKIKKCKEVSILQLLSENANQNLYKEVSIHRSY